MSSIDFPTSPTTGQQYSFEGKSWYWNAYGWVSIPYGGQVTTPWFEVGPIVTIVESLETTDSDMLGSWAAWHLINYV